MLAQCIQNVSFSSTTYLKTYSLSKMFLKSLYSIVDFQLKLDVCKADFPESVDDHVSGEKDVEVSKPHHLGAVALHCADYASALGPAEEISGAEKS